MHPSREPFTAAPPSGASREASSLSRNGCHVPIRTAGPTGSPLRTPAAPARLNVPEHPVPSPHRLARFVAGASFSTLVSVVACGPTASSTFAGPLPVPFTVSDYFGPTGYLGDGASAQDVTVVTMVNNACPTRSPSPVGDCYSVTYTQGSVDATQGYAGVLWQYPLNNFGAYPGHTVTPGATLVSGFIRGASGGEKVSLEVGGTDDPTLPYHDSISVMGSAMTLTTDWQPFTIGLPGSYGQVLCGFGWIVKAVPPGTADAPPVVFYLDGIAWHS